MRLVWYTLGMAIKTICQVPGQFTTKIEEKSVEVKVNLSQQLKLSKSQAKILDANLHNAIELVLAPHFMKVPKKK